jgi:hypothetical protein
MLAAARTAVPFRRMSFFAACSVVQPFARCVALPGAGRKYGEDVPQSLRENEKQQVPPLRYPAFPVQVGGVGELLAASFTGSRIRGSGWVSRCRKSGYAPVGMTILLQGNGQKRSDEWLLMVPQNCHPDRSVPGFPATRHSPAATCAAFSKESCKKFANATDLNRKCGVAQWRDLLFSGSHANSEGLTSLGVYGTAEAVPRSLLTPEGSR